MRVYLHPWGQLPLGKVVFEEISFDDVEAPSEETHRGDALRSIVVLRLRGRPGRGEELLGGVEAVQERRCWSER